MKIPKALLRERLVIRPYLGTGAYGPVWGDPQEVQGHVEPGFRVVTDRQGNEVVASAVAFILPGVEVGPESLVTWDGQDYEVIDAQPMRAWGKTRHIELTLRSRVTAGG